MNVTSPPSGSTALLSSNRLSGGVAILLGVALIWARPTVAEPTLNGDPGAGFFPLIVAAIIIVLGVFLALARSTDAKPQAEAPAPSSSPRLVVGAIFVAITIAYAVVFPILGYTVSTFGYLFVSAFALGPRTWKSVVWATVFAAVGTIASGEILTRGFGAFLPGVITL